MTGTTDCLTFSYDKYINTLRPWDGSAIKLGDFIDIKD